MDYYEHDLALVHARGHGQHADNCAPGILELLAPVRGGLVLELGCGAGALTRHLLAAGHRVVATERHEYVLVDTSLIPALLGRQGVVARVGSSFGAEQLPPGLRTVTGIGSGGAGI